MERKKSDKVRSQKEKKDLSLLSINQKKNYGRINKRKERTSSTIPFGYELSNDKKLKFQ